MIHSFAMMRSPAIVLLLLSATFPVNAASFFFSTGTPDGKMATATRPDASKFEIETADDFLLTSATSISSATFTGLMPSTSTVKEVVVEIYRVFPNDSNAGRTSGSPTFSTPQVPTRVNSPSDVAFDSRDSSGTLTFTTSVVASALTAVNSVQPGGINPKPNQTTGGSGAVTGEEVEFTVNFTTPFSLPADHYFFVPQVELDNGDFLWLSASKPIVAPGTPFLPDLQSWTRDGKLDPDWLRIGTDIVGAGAFNAAFTLTGDVPEPASLTLLGIAVGGLALARRRQAAI
jgi:hypothetical protein